MVAKRHAEIKARIKTVAVDFTQVVVDPAGAQEGAGEAGVNRLGGRHAADSLCAGEHDLVAGEHALVLVEEAREVCHQLAGGCEPLRRGIHAATAEALVVAHHAGSSERLEQIDDLFTLTEGVEQRGERGTEVVEQEANQTRVVNQAGHLGQNDAQVLGAIGYGLAEEFFHCEGVGPVGRQRAQVVEAVGVRHRPQITGVLGDLLVVAVQVAEDRFEFHNHLAVEGGDHAENAVGGRVLRAHRHLQ